jgi:small subunit ribosomal protein S21
MITIKVRANESGERAISRLKNAMVREGVLVTLKDRRYYLKPSLKKRRKREAAVRQRVKDLHKEIRQAQREEESFLE